MHGVRTYQAECNVRPGGTYSVDLAGMAFECHSRLSLPFGIILILLDLIDLAWFPRSTFPQRSVVVTSRSGNGSNRSNFERRGDGDW